jgi:hypothetical protein
MIMQTVYTEYASLTSSSGRYAAQALHNNCALYIT